MLIGVAKIKFLGPPRYKRHRVRAPPLQASLVGLHGVARQRERMWLRSRFLRLNPEYRLADNARKAAHGREAYHANLDEGRRKGVEKSRQRRLLPIKFHRRQELPK
jgi:hypothetical protein